MGKDDARKLYISHFLSTFGDRTWQFAVPMLLMDVWTDTLLPSAITGFTVAAACVFMMPYIGALIDSSRSRMHTMRISIFGEASCILAAAALYLPIVNQIRSGEDAAHSYLTYGCFAGIVALSVGAELTMRAGQISLEKDWAVVLAEEFAGSEGKKVRLTRINAIMRNIDLSCKLLGPTAFGFIAQLVSSEFASGSMTLEARATRIEVSVLTLAAWNLLFVPFEYYTLAALYDNIPALQIREEEHAHEEWIPDAEDTALNSPATRYGFFPKSFTCTQGHTHRISFTDAQRQQLDDGKTIEVQTQDHGEDDHSHMIKFKMDPQGTIKQVHDAPSSKSFIRNLIAGWSLYVSHDLFPALFGFCLLYFTVLDGGTLMSAYLKLNGIPEGYLGLSRGAGAVMGIVGTTLFPFLLKGLGQGSKDPVRDEGALLHAGQLTVWGFWFMLTPIGMGFFDLGSQTLAAWVMLGCVTFSRSMLWMFDSSISQLMQERIPEKHRGKVAGTQSALFSVMLMGVGIVGMIFSSPLEFEWLVVISVSNVFLAAVLYTYWYARQPGYSLAATLCGKEKPAPPPQTKYDTF